MTSNSSEDAKEYVTYGNREYNVIKEGLAEILNARKEEKVETTEAHQQSVFYNPIQQFNRDLSVLVIRAFSEDLAVIRKARHQRKLSHKDRKGKKQQHEEFTHPENTLKGVVDGQTLENDISKRDDLSNGQIGPHKKGGVIEYGKDADAGSRCSAPSKVSEGSNRTSSNTRSGTKRKIDFVGDIEYPTSIRVDTGEGRTETTQNEQSIGEGIHETLNNSFQDQEATDNARKLQGLNEGKVPQGRSNFDGVPKGPRKLLKNLDQKDKADELAQQPGQIDTQPQKPHFRILDALSATGLRALRYAKEIPSVSSVTANDLSSSATASIELNVRHNELAGKVHAVTGNALAHMYTVASNTNSILPKGEPGKYDVIDLDPYGTAAPFLDAAIQAIADGGLLCVTCTDSGVFASTGYLEKTFSQYTGLPLKGPQSHEAGLRLILHAIATSAARYGLAIEPLLSLSIDFYARVFVRIRKSPAEVKFLAGKTMLVYNCDAGCGAWSSQFIARTQAKKSRKGEQIYRYSLGLAPSTNSNCEHCGFKTHLSGPMWGGPLHNPYFIQRILDELPFQSKEIYATIPRIEGMLSIALQETILDHTNNTSPDTSTCEETSPNPFPSLNPASPDHHPFFIIPSVLSKVLHCVAPSDAAFRGALVRLGYHVTRSHCKPGSIRTDAPWSIIWEIMREWVRQKAPVKDGAVKPGMAGWGILQNDRSKIRLLSLKKELARIIEGASDFDKTKTEIEAALYRASKPSSHESAEVDKVEHTLSTNRDTETSAEGESLEQHSPSTDGVSAALRRSKLEIVFDENLGREREAKRMVRYQMNPRANWGPMNRAKGGNA